MGVRGDSVKSCGKVLMRQAMMIFGDRGLVYCEVTSSTHQPSEIASPDEHGNAVSCRELRPACPRLPTRTLHDASLVVSSWQGVASCEP